MKLQSHLKKSTIDTMIGMIINIPLNFITISVALHYEWTATQMTVIFTIFFTVMGIIRKSITNWYFYGRDKHNDLHI